MQERPHILKTRQYDMHETHLIIAKINIYRYLFCLVTVVLLVQSCKLPHSPELVRLFKTNICIPKLSIICVTNLKSSTQITAQQIGRMFAPVRVDLIAWSFPWKIEQRKTVIWPWNCFGSRGFYPFWFTCDVLDWFSYAFFFFFFFRHSFWWES